MPASQASSQRNSRKMAVSWLGLLKTRRPSPLPVMTPSAADQVAFPALLQPARLEPEKERSGGKLGDCPVTGSAAAVIKNQTPTDRRIPDIASTLKIISSLGHTRNLFCVICNRIF